MSVPQRGEQPVALRGFAHPRALRRGEPGIPRRRFGAHQISRLVLVRAAVHQHVRELVREHDGKIARARRDPDRVRELRAACAIAAADRLGIEGGTVESILDELDCRPRRRDKLREFTRNRRSIVAKTGGRIDELERDIDEAHAASRKHGRHVSGRGQDSVRTPRSSFEGDERETQAMGGGRCAAPRQVGCGKRPALNRPDRGRVLRMRRCRAQERSDEKRARAGRAPA